MNDLAKARALLASGTPEAQGELLSMLPTLLDRLEAFERDAEEWIDLPRMTLGRP